MWTCSYCEMLNEDTVISCRFCNRVRNSEHGAFTPPPPPPARPKAAPPQAGRPQPAGRPPQSAAAAQQSAPAGQQAQRGKQGQQQGQHRGQQQGQKAKQVYNQAGKRTRELAEEKAPVFPAGFGTDATVYQPIETVSSVPAAAPAAAPEPARKPAAPSPVSKPSDILKSINSSPVNDAVNAKRKRLRIGLIAANAALLVVNIIGIIMIVK